MVLVWGSRLMGKCDVVPGMFHVATMCGHFFYIPFVPKQSYVVLEQTGDSFRGVPIAMSGKSVGLAWARLIVFFFALTSSMAVTIPYLDGKKGQWIGPAMFAAALWGVLILLNSRVVTKANVTRACQLGSEIGLSEEGATRLLAIYDNPGGGFEVAPAKPKAAAR